MKKVNLLYFSPTGTTKKTLRNILAGLNIENVEEYDLSKPIVREKLHVFDSNELVMIGMPVYAGRLPQIFHDYDKIVGKNTPAIFVVVYGNREYEDALLELKNIGEKSKLKTIGAAAFIAEHSLNNEIAKDRPDSEDIKKEIDFGKSIIKKLNNLTSKEKNSTLKITGNFPYKNFQAIPLVPGPNNKCKQCGLCEKNCPTEVIDKNSFKVINKSKCIFCFRCVKYCPVNSRGIRGFKKIIFNKKMNDLKKICNLRKEPEIFI